MKSEGKADLREALAWCIAWENQRLKDRVRVLEAEVAVCDEETNWIRRELRTETNGHRALKELLMALQSGIVALSEISEEKEQENEAKVKVLGRCLRKEKPEHIHRLAKVADLGLRKKRFMPARLIRDLGWDYSTGHNCIALLKRIGIFEREKYGHYSADPNLRRETLKEEIPRRMARHEGKKGVQDNPEETR